MIGVDQQDLSSFVWLSAVTFKVSVMLNGSIGSCWAVLRRGPVHLVVAVLKMASSDLDSSGQVHLLLAS